MQTQLSIRRATAADAPLIAWAILEAMWIDDADKAPLMASCEALARMDDSLYSWRNSLVGEADGEVAAVLVAYDGASYRAAARRTFEFVRDAGGADFTQMEQEAAAGEWYLDSLAVWPAWRRRGIARQMLRYGIDEGLSREAVSRVTLNVDPDHAWVAAFYAKLGFHPAERLRIFDQDFRKMEFRREAKD